MKNIQLGLCCLFVEEPVKFRTTTLRYLKTLNRREQLCKLSEICRHNGVELLRAVKIVNKLKIKVFRISSALFPLVTHPEAGYELEELPECHELFGALEQTRIFGLEHNMRLSFHPDQFVVPASPNPLVASASRRELLHQLRVAELIGANEINIHMGGVYGDKTAVLQRFRQVFEKLPTGLQQRLTLENDDRSYTVADLIGLCRDLEIPLVYDVHHHRCNPDSFSVEEATDVASNTWRKNSVTPHFHISSPRDGWNAKNTRPHADYINPKDFPDCWLEIDVAVDVEAKAKEKAIIKLRAELQNAT